MALVKWVKGKKSNGEAIWEGIYDNALRNRLRRDKNLADLTNKADARKNLELIGDNVETHYHDSRYMPYIKTLQGDTKALRTDMTQAQNDINAHTNRLNGHDTDITNLQSRATKLESRATDLEARATGLEKRATSAEKEITNLKNADTVLQTRATKLEDRATKLENRAKNLENDVSYIKNNPAPRALLADRATNADNAANATKATNDGSNRNIVNTYATKNELNTVKQAATLAVPIGCILPYAGSLSKIPAGWKLCNGQNGTPDLRDRFIVGAGHSYNSGAKGGEASKKLTVDMLPEHRHTFFAAGSTDSDGHGGIHCAVQTISDGVTGVAITNGVYDEKSPVGRAAGEGGRQMTKTGERAGSPYLKGTKESGVNSTGGVSLNGQTASIQQGISLMPPYYALYYIMHTG